MTHSRESIYAALFALVSSTAGIKTKSRRWKPWTQVSAAEQPALFQIQRKELAVTRDARGIPTKWELHVDLILYANTGEDPATAPSQILNPIIDAFEKALPKFPLVQTLGGLVQEAFIDGEVMTDEGTLGAQAVVIVPVKIIAV